MFKDLFEKTKLADPTGDRKKAFKQFEALGFPSRSNEAWKYTSLKPIQKTYQLPVASAAQVSVAEQEIAISCVNGYFDIEAIKKTLSPMNVFVTTITEALSLGKLRAQDSKDSFLALNSAFYETGLYLEVSSKSQITKPLVVKHSISQGQTFVNPKIYIEMKDESSIEFAEVFSIQNSEYLLNSSLQVNVGKRASFKLMKHFNEEFVSSHIDNTMIWQAEASSCQAIQLGKGSQLLRQNFEVSIEGSDSSTDVRGIALLYDDRKMDSYIKIHHKAPSSMSRQAFRSILRDQAHYVFQGNIRIEKEAQKTDSDQVNRNLMLGQKCHVDTKPQLDVFADDVKATHGAAIGQLNPDEKFYLESRAISPETALSLLCAGFALDLLEDLKSKWIKNYLRENL